MVFVFMFWLFYFYHLYILVQTQVLKQFVNVLSQGNNGQNMVSLYTSDVWLTEFQHEILQVKNEHLNDFSL